MAQPRRKCRLADSEHRDVDLRMFEKEIIDTINNTVPGKSPRVFRSYFSTAPLTQSEAVAIGRSLSKVEKLKGYGKTVTTFRLFDGKTYESEDSNIPLKASYKHTANDNSDSNTQTASKPKRKPIGGRLR